MTRFPEPLIPTSFNVLQRIPGNEMGDETNNAHIKNSNTKIGYPFKKLSRILD